MKPYLLALGAGLLVGIAYSLMGVRSPAPPIVALVGLFGILMGEQIVPVARRLVGGDTVSLAVIREKCGEQVLGTPPGRADEDRPQS